MARDIRPTRWRAMIAVEFTTTDYEHTEEGGAMRTAELAAQAVRRGDQDINSSRPVVTLVKLERQ